MIKTSITFKGSDGRTYPDAGSMLKASIGRIVDDRIRAVDRAIQPMMCPEHHERATVEKTHVGDQHSWKIKACCNKFAKEAQEAGGRALASGR